MWVHVCVCVCVCQYVSVGAVNLILYNIVPTYTSFLADVLFDLYSGHVLCEGL